MFEVFVITAIELEPDSLISGQATYLVSKLGYQSAYQRNGLTKSYSRDGAFGRCWTTRQRSPRGEATLGCV